MAITPRNVRRMAQLVFVALAVMLLLGAGDDNARFSSLGHKLMCQCGCNQVLLECNHVGCTVSERMRGELTAAMNRGDNNDLILQGFVQKYGNVVLAAPTTTGFNRVAWIIPYLALIIGLGAVILVVRTWKMRRVPAPAANASQLDPGQLESFRQRARHETEL